jgi:hypothetical protein
MNEDARHFVGGYSHPYLLTMAPCYFLTDVLAYSIGRCKYRRVNSYGKESSTIFFLIDRTFACSGGELQYMQHFTHSPLMCLSYPSPFQHLSVY